MAVKRSPAQRAELAGFVRFLYAESGATTWREFADRAHVHWASLSDWQTAKSVPDGWNLLRLILASGVGVGRLSDELAARRADPLREIAEQLHYQTGVLDTLLEVARRLDAQPVVPQAGRTRRRRA